MAGSDQPGHDGAEGEHMMEPPGPFQGSREDVMEYIDVFYRGRGKRMWTALFLLNSEPLGGLTLCP